VTRRALDVGIVGCGTAGAAASVFLARAGHRVTLFERVDDPRPIGAGIVLQPTGQAVLGALGLREQIVSRGARIDRLRVVTPGGRRVMNLVYEDFDPTMFGVGVHRGALFASLFAAVAREPVDLRLGVSIERLTRVAHDRVAVLDTHGRRHGPYDLVVVADGSRSQLRAASPARVSPYAWGALWSVVDDPEQIFQGELHQVVRGTSTMLGFLPTGFGPEQSHTTPLVSVYWSLRGDRVEELLAGGLDAWKGQVLSYAPHAEPILDRIASREQVLFTSYQHVSMSRWASHDVVYVGDAAHSMSPQLGQGCNLALVDAWTLAASLATHDDVASALCAYVGARSDHLRFYQFATRALTPFFQSDLTPLGWVRDVGMGTAHRFRFFNRLMTASMCGTMTGLLSRLPLPGSQPAARG
jgi:2-polyprenyl-6-methoxyphenol hydroxylase-like FAD-dependent oxidoreductase